MSYPNGRSVRTSVAERTEWVRRLERSGQSALAFAREHGLSAHSVGRWRRQALGGAAPPGERRSEFHTVALPGSTRTEWAAELELAGGGRLRLRSGTPAVWVRELVEALR